MASGSNRLTAWPDIDGVTDGIEAIVEEEAEVPDDGAMDCVSRVAGGLGDLIAIGRGVESDMVEKWHRIDFFFFNERFSKQAN